MRATVACTSTTSTHCRTSWPTRRAWWGSIPSPAWSTTWDGRPPDMRYGYWLPVFGGWLRNVPDEGMDATWAYVRRLAQRSEALGFDRPLFGGLNFTEFKGPTAPPLDA